MTDKEVNKTFLNTLKAPYYDRMIGNSNKDFSDVVFTGEMIKAGGNKARLKLQSLKNNFPRKKREKPT